MYRLLQSSGGFSRTNNFRVELALPSVLRSWYDVIDVVNLSCSATELPGVSLETIEAGTGPSSKPEMAFASRQRNVDLNFYISKDYKERALFQEWKDLIVDDVTQTVGYYDDYVGELNIFPMKRGQGGIEYNTLIGSKLHQAYPKHIGNIQYSYDADGQIAILPVTMTFYRYELF